MKDQISEEMKPIIMNLKYLCRTYDGISKLIVSTKNRLNSINPEKYKLISEMKDFKPKRGLSLEANAERVENMDPLQLLVWAKGKTSREIGKEIKFWDVWTHWLSDVPGVGPFLAGNLILFYYYRFLPICQECGEDLVRLEKEDKKTGKIIGFFQCPICNKSAKGEGNLKHRIELRDFEKVSNLWSYMGIGIKDGKKPKLVKGVVANWSTKARTLMYHYGDQVNRQQDDHLYKAFLLKMKTKHERKNNNGDRKEKWPPGHIHNAAKNEVGKLFISHFWHVARTLDGKDTEPGPYIKQIPGHTVISPYYWEGE